VVAAIVIASTTSYRSSSVAHRVIPANLWPQPLTATLPDGTAIGADEKDDLEDELKRRVRDGTVNSTMHSAPSRATGCRLGSTQVGPRLGMPEHRL
jgi:hypothetical protein